MKKVGLVTIFQVPNYGSVLQAYATQTIIESFGCHCEIVNYCYPNKWQYEHGMKKRTLKNKLLYFVRSNFGNGKIKQLIRFRKTHLHLTPKLDYQSVREHDWIGFSNFIVGSDQVWKMAYNRHDPTFLLDFLPNNIPRFSVASSFGTDILPEQDIELFKTQLSKFKSISVREKNGIKIIESLNISVSCRLLLDPTLLLTDKQWLSLIPEKTKSPTKKKYILLYLLSYAFNPRPYIYEVVKKFQQDTGADVVALAGFEKNNNVTGLKIIDKTNVSVYEFLELFQNAELVVTSSFHGTAFSIIFGKPLVSVVPTANSDDRQLSLLNQLGIKQCATSTSTPLDKINPYYDNGLVQKKLNEIRVSSLQWIKDNLKD